MPTLPVSVLMPRAQGLSFLQGRHLNTMLYPRLCPRCRHSTCSGTVWSLLFLLARPQASGLEGRSRGPRGTSRPLSHRLT